MWRLQLITGFLIGLLGLSGSVAWAAPSLAITVTFNDATESPSVSTDNPGRVTASNCALGLEGREVCLATIAVPISGAIVTSTTIPDGGLFIADPGGVTVSDIVAIVQPDYDVQFVSDFLEIPIGPCAAFGGCQRTEDGTIQLAGTVTWSLLGGGTVIDTIQFQSGVERSTVPEPSSILLFLIGLAVLGISKYSRWAGSRSRWPSRRPPLP